MTGARRSCRLCPTRGERAGGRAAALFPADPQPCPVAARFHLHPDIRALALSGRAVVLTLPDGTRWLLRSGATTLALGPARYYDESRARPRATMQVVATVALLRYGARFDWRLERIGARPLTPARHAGAAAN